MSSRAAAECPPRERFRPNGAPKRRTTNGASKAAPALETPRVSEAPYAEVHPEPLDAAMWPIQPGVWFQPERPPAFHKSGLDLSKRNRLPVADFSRIEAVEALDTGRRPEMAGAPAAPPVRAVAPESGLALLGWDPRAAFWKEGEE